MNGFPDHLGVKICGLAEWYWFRQIEMHRDFFDTQTKLAIIEDVAQKIKAWGETWGGKLGRTEHD